MLLSPFRIISFCQSTQVFKLSSFNAFMVLSKQSWQRQISQSMTANLFLFLSYRVVFLTGPPDLQYQNEKQVFHEIFNVRKLLVGWASFFHFSTENRADQLKNHPVCIFRLQSLLSVVVAASWLRMNRSLIGHFEILVLRSWNFQLLIG